MNEPESFDKVFSVPAVPGSHTNGVHEETSPPSTEPPTIPQEKLPIEPCISKIDGDTNGCPDDEEYIPKTPSTAERRKIFETRSNSKENEPEDNFDSLDSTNFERASLQRSSIAERRKMYERSQSVQESTGTIIEKPDGSPVMLRRKDSFKARKTNEEGTKKNVPKQQSLDPQAARKTEPVTPTPKRTSTVFGIFLTIYCVFLFMHRLHCRTCI